MSRQDQNLTLVVQPLAFFKELVSEALNRRRTAVQPETEFYLVNLLNQFMTTDRLYQRDSEGQLREEPLALMLKEALDEAHPEGQRALFRQVGDVSLYVAGYFQDSLSRKLVDVDYYIGLGGTAYQRVAAKADDTSARALYRELADKFSTFVDVLADVSDKTQPKGEKDILRMYELWLRTRSDRAAKALQEAGITPNEALKKNLQ
jgi:hypothetical protein